MYSTSLITLLASAATLATALPSADFFFGRHRRNSVPAQYKAARGYAQDADLLEDYDVYHERYLTFECQNKHNTEFWDTCCHPVLNTQDPETALPDMCWDAVDDGGECDAGGSSDDGGSSTKAPGNPAGDPPASSTTTAPGGSETGKSDGGSKDGGSGDSGSGDSGSSDDGGSGSWNGPGYGTWYKQDGNPGACGKTHGEDDLIVAIDEDRWGHNKDFGIPSDLCGKKVFIQNMDNKKTVTATIADVCPTCEQAPGGDVKNSIDMSLGTFQKLADLNDGQILIQWKFV